MKIRKIVYHVDCVHILTFRDHYRRIVAPYFGYPNVEYAIDNENTINEGFRLLFPNEGFLIQLKKESFLLFFEGDVSEIKKQNPIVALYFEIVEKIRIIPEFNKIVRHRFFADAVDIEENHKIHDLLVNNVFLRNPFGKLDEFSTVFEFAKDGKSFSFKFGNYNEKDIKKFDLSPFNTIHNVDLKGNVGLFSQASVSEETNSISFNKFKALLSDVETVINTYKTTMQ